MYMIDPYNDKLMESFEREALALRVIKEGITDNVLREIIGKNEGRLTKADRQYGLLKMKRILDATDERTQAEIKKKAEESLRQLSRDDIEPLASAYEEICGPEKVLGRVMELYHRDEEFRERVKNSVTLAEKLASLAERANSPEPARIFTEHAVNNLVCRRSDTSPGFINMWMNYLFENTLNPRECIGAYIERMQEEAESLEKRESLAEAIQEFKMMLEGRYPGLAGDVIELLNEKYDELRRANLIEKYGVLGRALVATNDVCLGLVERVRGKA